MASTTNKCKCCKYTCNACPGGTKKLPPSFDVTLSGIAAGAYGYNVLNKTWTVTYDPVIAKWIFQTSNPPFMVPYNWIFGDAPGVYSGYSSGDPTGVDAGDLVTIYCFRDGLGFNKLRLFAGVFDSEPIGLIPPFIAYWRRCRWTIYEFVIDGTNTCSPLFIQQTSSVDLFYNNAWPGFGPTQISTQSPTLTISP